MALDHKDMARAVWEETRLLIDKHVHTDPKTGRVTKRRAYHPESPKELEPLMKGIIDYLKDNAEVEFDNVSTVISATTGGPVSGRLRKGTIK